MRFAKHLAVANIGCAALAPCRYMVSVHFAVLPNTAGVIVRTQRTKRTIRFIVCLCYVGLLRIHGFFRGLLKDTDFKQPGVSTAAQNVLKHARALFDGGITIQF